MRLKPTKRQLWWAAIGFIAAVVVATVIVALERARQRKILAEAQVSLWVEEAWQHPFHDPIVQSLRSMGLSHEHIRRVSWWLELFADGYAIRNAEHSSPRDNRSFPYLRGWPATKARDFGIWYPEFSDSDFENLGEMPRLKKLFFHGGKTTDEIFPMMAKQAPNLEFLYIADNPSIRGEHLDQLQFLRAAKSAEDEFTLMIDSVPIDDAGFEKIAENAPGITSLTLGSTRISDNAIKSLSKLTALRELVLVDLNNEISGENFELLANLEALKTLKISDRPRMGVRRLLETSMPNLEKLDLHGVKLATFDVKRIENFAPNLTYLNLSSTGIGDYSLYFLVPLKKLTYLDLGGNPDVTKQAQLVLRYFPASMNLNAINTQMDPNFDPSRDTTDPFR